MTKKKAQRGKSKASVTERQNRFVQAYIANGENATQAYLTVNPHVTTGSAGVEGHRLLKIPRIQQAIEKHRAELRLRFALTTDRVVQELARVAYFDPRRMLDEKGTPVPLHKLDDNTAAGLSLELDGDSKVLKMRTVRPSEKNTAVEKAVRILRLYDKPPPPPPELPGEEHVDQRDVARRMAFLLAQEAHTADRERKPAPAPVKRKKVSIPA